MKKLLKVGMFALMAVIVAIALWIPQQAEAGDMGPQYYSGSLSNGAGILMPIATNGWGRFTPAYLVFKAAAAETQTVSYACAGGTVTNTYGTKVISATDHVLAITNVPPMFKGDHFVITSSTATGITNIVTAVGTLFE